MTPEYQNGLAPGEAFRQELEQDDEYQEEIARMQEAARVEAIAKAQKIYRKNKRELDRLNHHAQTAVLENNFEAYKYAIEKSRTILRQPFTDEIILTGWNTTRRQIWEIINDHSKGV
ncbi:hypothetical protein [Serratia phage X20]|uniref:Uncharacterized protein n=3 Tax=Winklervirus TaxID=2560256 RepID=A0A1Z1LYX3_9CAUD|nr:hypothetical protein FDI23_gp060 [Serratia phage CHI14]YP_010092208.1 hypothetical protein KNT72_gp057 [Serratia phage X20]ARW57758.1 hypothetical protein [Serratia phage CBH8]QYN80502.1 hypothetical protein [Kosakonia phage Kc304]UYM28711.1 hypothetical protein [Serratia phage vB_SspM_LC53]ARW57483.1 hypothetical protein [Serratia phage CHI14]ARW58030.1 hypothetical protein [Serratia phage X20]